MGERRESLIERMRERERERETEREKREVNKRQVGKRGERRVKRETRENK